jgi:cell division protease FtsH
MARKMVCEWGMSDVFGPVAFGNHQSGASGEDNGRSVKNFSDATAVEIDTEIRSIVTTAYNEVRTLLQSNSKALELLTAELVIRETMGSSEIDEIMYKS